MSAVATIAESAKRKAWHAYVQEPHRSLRDIAAVELGLDPRAFRRRRAQWGWPARHAAITAERLEVERRLPGVDPALAAMVPLSVLDAANADRSRPPAFAEVARRLRRVLLTQLEDLEPGPGDLDRTVKILATIPKSVDAIRALERLDDPAPGNAADPDGADHDEPPPRSLEELRQELARHLDRLAEEEALERGFGFDDEEGAGESP